MNLVLLIIAWIGFWMFSIIGIPYSAIYYLSKERKKPIPYARRYAIGVDMMCNAAFGELLELMFSEKRGITFFGTNVTVSAALGHLIETNNVNKFGLSVSSILDKLDSIGSHCLNAYKEEILNINKDEKFN